MILPDPNPVALLKAILDKDVAGPILSSAPGLFSLSPILHPCIFYDIGSGTFGWTKSGTGTDYEANYTLGAGYVTGGVITLKTKATSPTGGDDVYAEQFLPLGPGPIIRLQLVFRRPTGTSTHYTSSFRLTADNEINTLYAIVEAHWQSARIAYRKKSNGSWAMTEMTDSRIQPDNQQWHKLDVAINVLTHEWVHIILNGKSLSITAPELEPAGSTNRGRTLALRLGTLAVAAGRAETQVDELLLTTEEA